MSKRIVIKSIEQYEQRLKRHRQYYASKLMANAEQNKLRVERRIQYFLKLKQYLESQQPHQHKSHLGWRKDNIKHMSNEIGKNKELVIDQQTKEHEDITSKRPEWCKPLKNGQECAVSNNLKQDEKSEAFHHSPIEMIKTEMDNKEYDNIYYNMESGGNFKHNVHEASNVVPEFDLADGVISKDSQTQDAVYLWHEYEVRKHLKMETNVETESVQNTFHEEKNCIIDKHVEEVTKHIQLKPFKYYHKGDIIDSTNIETSNDYTGKNIHIKIEPLDE